MRSSHVRAFCRYEWPRGRRNHRHQRKWARRQALLRRYKRFVRYEAPGFWEALYADGRPLTAITDFPTYTFSWFEIAT